MVDWKQPSAFAAAHWLLEHIENHDFRSVAVLVPGRRARRVFQRVLLEQHRVLGGRGAVIAPRVVTPAGLIETFFTRVDHREIASPMTAMLYWLDAFRHLRSTESSVLDPQQTAEQERQMYARVRSLRGVCDELDELGLVPSSVPQHVEIPGTLHRWSALDVLRSAAHERMRDAGYVESTSERRKMIDQGDLVADAPEHLLVVGVSDPGVLAGTAISHLADRTRIMIDAPESEAESFDDLGRPIPGSWNRRPSPIPFSDMRLVDRPVDAAEQVLDELTALHVEHGPFEPGDVVVGLCDETFSVAIERAARRSGARLRAAVGPSLSQTEVAGILRGVQLFIREGSVSAFGELLRMPSIERLLSEGVEGVDLLDLLDFWRADRVGGTLDDLRAGNVGRRKRDIAPLVEALRRFDKLIEPILASERSADAIEALGVFLNRMTSEQQDDARLTETLSPIQAVFDVVRNAPDDLSLSVDLLIQLCSEALAQTNQKPEEVDRAVDLLGWLELRHDPVRDLILVAVNESGELASRQSDGWLPDSVREKLGLMSESRRRARDAHAMHVLCHRSRSLKAIVARRNVDGDPIAPSRLFLGADGEESARRVVATMDDKEARPRVEPAFSLAGTAVPVDDSAFEAALPPESLDVNKISVTAFSAWMRSPLRYWLERRERLDFHDPDVLELDPRAFGDLAHDVLHIFGLDPVAASTDSDQIAEFLSDTLDQMVRQRYGAPCAPAIAVQQETLRARLNRFASIHAAEVQRGWRISECEVERTAMLEIPGGAPVELVGRIDRIDVHEDGHIRVLDYKTSEKRVRPSQARAKDGTWRDLQLPLYDYLLRHQEVEVHGAIELGYIALCRDVNDIGIETAKWTPADIQDGIHRAHEIVNEMRSGQFDGGTAKPGRTVDAIDRILRVGVLDLDGGDDEDGEDFGS